MDEREQYRRKAQAQLDEWTADLEKLKARASGASAEARLQMNEQIKELEGKVEESKVQVAELSETSDEAWELVKERFDSAWESVKSAFSDAAAKFKE